MRRAYSLRGVLVVLAAAVLVVGAVVTVVPSSWRGGVSEETRAAEREAKAAERAAERAARAARKAAKPLPPVRTRSGWVLRDLGTLGGPQSQATGINGRGQIVGWADTERKDSSGDPIRHAFVWENGKMRDLTPGGPESVATGINERGEIVGWSRIRKGGQHAVIWRKGKMRDLGVSVPDSLTLAMNDSGEVVGTRADLVAFAWRNGRVRTLGGENSQASAINSRGQVVGQTFLVAANGAALFHAFLWEKGRMRDLGGLGGESSSAYGISDRGQVVGQADLRAKDAESKYEDTIHNAFFWENGKMQSVGSAKQYSTAYDINEEGQVVGSVTALGENQDSGAVLWEDGKRIGLGSLGFGSEAVAINERGQVVGWSETRDWDERAVLWTLKRG